MWKGEKAVFGERLQGNSNHMHHDIQDLLKNYGCFTLCKFLLHLCNAKCYNT